MRTILELNEPGRRSRTLGNVFKGGGGINPGVVRSLRDGKAPDLRGAAVLRGHVPLGIREYLPNCFPRKTRTLRYYTILRDPVERMLSHYYGVLEEGGGHGLPPLPRDATLEQAAEDGYLYDNLQT